MKTSNLIFNRLSQNWLVDGVGTKLVFSSELVLGALVKFDDESVLDFVTLVDDGSGHTLLSIKELASAVYFFPDDRRDSLKSSVDLANRIYKRDPSQISQVDPIILLEDLSNLLQKDALEESLEANSSQLKNVFHNPNSELEYIAERVSASRAKRISRRAIQILAGHSQDWLKASGAGVTPRVIEALERDEDLNIYENRVAARLIDDVRRHLLRLLEEDESLAVLMQDIKGPFRKNHRLYSLWGRVPPDDQLKDTHMRRNLRIKDLLLLVEHLRDSHLYKNVPRRARVNYPIQFTNLLNQDLNYRGVRGLWIEWWRTRSPDLTPREKRAKNLREVEAFFSFTWLVVCRAAGNLSDKSENKKISESEIEFVSKRFSVFMKPANSFDKGSWVLSTGIPNRGSENMETLLVALASQILQGSNSEVCDRVVEIVNRVPIARFSNVIVCFPGTYSDLKPYEEISELKFALCPIASPPSYKKRTIWLVPISPLDLESTERLERVVRWIFLHQAMLNYPPEITVRKELVDSLTTICTAKEFNVKQKILELKQIPNKNTLIKLEKEIESQIQKLNAQPQKSGSAEAQDLQKLNIEIKSSNDFLSTLAVCPICDSQGELTGRSSQTFQSFCNICESRWGLRHEPAEDARLPYLWLGQGISDLPQYANIARWLGRDLLSEPCQSSGSEYGTELINPWTGTCTASLRIKSSCERCK